MSGCPAQGDHPKRCHPQHIDNQRISFLSEVHGTLFLHLVLDGAQFHDEGFQLAQNGRFQILFLKCALESEKIEKIRIAEHKVGGQSIFFPQSLEFNLCQLCRLFGKSGPLIQHRADLAPQGAHAPSLQPTHFSIEIALE